MDVITRKEAKERWLPRYFTGKPCPHGHVAERWASTSRCVECDRKYDEANREKIRERQRKYGLPSVSCVDATRHRTRAESARGRFVL